MRRFALSVARVAVPAAGLIGLWQAVVWLTGAPPYILPTPLQVAVALGRHHVALLGHLGVTLTEIVLGLAIGTAIGAAGALVIGYYPAGRRWLLPVLVASQAVPVIVLAPILVLWLGYGMASKVAMATLIIFFPVTAAFLDGLKRCEPGWVDLAQTMVQGALGPRRARLAVLFRIRLPAALPAFASGLRVATAVAPIGAVVGEWVGSSAGLGYLMLHANGRMQVDVMFAALFVLALASLGLWFAVDAGLRRAIPWQSEALSDAG